MEDDSFALFMRSIARLTTNNIRRYSVQETLRDPKEVIIWL